MYLLNQNNFTKGFKQWGCFTSQLLTLCATLLLSAQVLADVPALKVEGKHIKANGKIVSLAGMSLFWSNTYWGGEKFYNKESIAAIKNNFGASLVRVAMGVEDDWGYLDQPRENEQRVITAVDAAIANDLYVIIDWHSHNAQDYESEAIEFFKKMAKKYGNKNNVIYEIYNEPVGVSWSRDIKPYAEAVIKEIRKIDPDNLIVVGTPNWSQKVTDAANDPITSYSNIAYTLHFYAATPAHQQPLRDEALEAMKKNIAIFVTEWGTVEYTGNGNFSARESDKWVKFMQDNNISHANWSLNDKDETASVLKEGASTKGDWSNNDLTDSGKYIKQVINNWTGAPTTVKASTRGKRYTWNNGQEDTFIKQMNSSVINGQIRLTLRASNKDPYLRLQKTNADVSNFNTVRLRVRNDSTGSAWKLFFKPQGKSFSGNAVNFNVPTDNKWHYVDVRMTTDKDWKNTITELRIDPTPYSSGNIVIDTVVLVNK